MHCVTPVRARKHRLPDVAYRGIKTVAFTAAVHERKRLFVDDVVVNAMVEILTVETHVSGCLVPIYCFMPDHLHVCVTGQHDSADVKRAMDSFKHHSGTWLSARRPEFRWQDQYWDRIIRKTEDWKAHVAYTFCNPLRAGLTTDAWDYPFTGSIGYDLREIITDAYW